MAELDNLRFIVEGLGLVSNLLMDLCKFYLFLQVFVGIFGIIGNISGILWFSRKLIQKNFHQVSTRQHFIFGISTLYIKGRVQKNISLI